MKFKTKSELQDIIDGGVYKCDKHGIILDIKDTKSIQEHEAEKDHTLTGSSPCQRCGEIVRYEKADNVIQPKIVGREPGAFCSKCKKELKKELFSNE